MGFFSDLKEDLSQAVGEYKPADKDVNVANESTEDVVTLDNAELDTMLEKIDISGIDFDTDKVEAVEEIPTEVAPENTYYEAAESQIIDEPVVNSKSALDEVSCIMQSMIINGNMATAGSLEVKGQVVGNVECLGKLNITGSIQGNSSGAEVYAEGAKIMGEVRSEGPIKIGQSTTIIGNVFATSAVVAGAVKGDIDVRGPVILDSTAIVLGNIKSKAVQINNGAVIEGMCSQCYAEVNPKSFFEELKKIK